jgi:hypothetical protein
MVLCPWRRTAGVEPCEVKASSRVLNEGDEETGLFRPRLVATQRCGFQQQLKAGVGRTTRQRECYQTSSKRHDCG